MNRPHGRVRRAHHRGDGARLCARGVDQARRGERLDHLRVEDRIRGLVGPTDTQGTSNLVALLEQMRPADMANALQDLADARRNEVAAALSDRTLADVLEELPEHDQVEILIQLDRERAADVLERMDPDDAADLLAEGPRSSRELAAECKCHEDSLYRTLRALANAGAHEVAQLLQPRIGDPVADVLAVTPARDHPGDRQPVEVLRNVRHRHAGPLGQLAHAQLAVVVARAAGAGRRGTSPSATTRC